MLRGKSIQSGISIVIAGMETQEWKEFQQMTPEQVKIVSAKHIRKPI